MLMFAHMLAQLIVTAGILGTVVVVSAGALGMVSRLGCR